MPDIDSGGWRIHYQTHGDLTNPPIIMVLGLSHRLAHWGKMPGLLGEKLFVITFDCRGMGQSELRDEAFTIGDEVGDVANVLDAVGIKSATVYGRSRGGMIAQEFALTHPERVSALILTGTSHRGPGAVGQSETVQKAMNFGPDLTREQIFEAQNVAMASPGWRERDPEGFGYNMKVDLEAPPRRFAVQRQQGSIAGWSSKDRLAGIAKPTLAICGADDGMTPPENSRQIAKLIPGAKLHMIPQCGHNPMLEKPQAEAEAILAFLGH